MTTIQFIVLIAAILLGVLAFVLKGRKKSVKDQVRRIVDQAKFEVESGGVFPIPKSIDSSLYKGINATYSADRELRTLLSEYFLKYDSILLKSGLLTVHAENDLIGALWENESSRNGVFRESPSSTEMRDHIKSDLTWFGTSSALTSLISSNETSFDALKSTW